MDDLLEKLKNLTPEEKQLLLNMLQLKSEGDKKPAKKATKKTAKKEVKKTPKKTPKKKAGRPKKAVKKKTKEKTERVKKPTKAILDQLKDLESRAEKIGRHSVKIKNRPNIFEYSAEFDKHKEDTKIDKKLWKGVKPSDRGSRKVVKVEDNSFNED